MSPAAIPADSSTSAGSPVPTPLIPEAGPYFEGDERANGERMLADDWCVTAGPDSARIAAHARKALYEFDRSFARGWKTRPSPRGTDGSPGEGPAVCALASRIRCAPDCRT